MLRVSTWFRTENSKMLLRLAARFTYNLIIISCLMIMFLELLYLIVNLFLLQDIADAGIENKIVNIFQGTTIVTLALFVLGLFCSPRIRFFLWLGGLSFILYLIISVQFFSLTDVFELRLVLAVLAVLLLVFAADMYFGRPLRLLVWLAAFVFMFVSTVIMIDHQQMYGLSVGQEFGYLAFDSF